MKEIYWLNLGHVLKGQGISGYFFRNKDAGRYHFSSTSPAQISKHVWESGLTLSIYLASTTTPPPWYPIDPPIQPAYFGGHPSKAAPAGTRGRNWNHSKRIHELGRSSLDYLYTSMPTVSAGKQGGLYREQVLPTKKPKAALDGSLNSTGPNPAQCTHSRQSRSPQPVGPKTIMAHTFQGTGSPRYLCGTLADTPGAPYSCDQGELECMAPQDLFYPRSLPSRPGGIADLPNAQKQTK